MDFSRYIKGRFCREDSCLFFPCNGNSDMRKWPLKYRLFFMPVLSLGILFFSSYAQFYSLEILDAFRKTHWERPFHKELTANITKKFQGVEPFIKAFMFFQGKDFFNLFLPLSLIFLLPKRNYILRC